MARQNTAPTAAGPPLARLYEHAGLPAWGLPQELAAVYGGDLGFTEPCVYANFVASVDGVTALGPEYPSSGSAISGHDPADRFVMGLLRACADMLAGRAETSRPGLVAARELLPGRAEQAELASVRHRGSYLFLRYRLRRRPAGPGYPGGCG
jgi:hypothetical protein